MNPQRHSRIILVLRHAQALCVPARKQYPPSLFSSLGQPPKAYDLALQLPRTAANGNFANHPDRSTTYKTHRLPRGAASFKSLYLNRPYTAPQRTPFSSGASDTALRLVSTDPLGAHWARFVEDATSELGEVSEAPLATPNR
jgi:hypothetical protein